MDILIGGAAGLLLVLYLMRRKARLKNEEL